MLRFFILLYVKNECYCVQVLTFKEINWQSLRIEADAIESNDQDLSSTPLRLITNQGRIRIALKRRVRLTYNKMYNLWMYLIKYATLSFR